MRPLAWRFSVGVTGGAVLALFVFLYRDRPQIYFSILNWWSVNPFRVPFIDLRFILAAIECRRQGLDPFIANPCDLFHQAYNYSPLFLEAARLEVTSRSADWLGIGFGLIMIVSAVSLPVPRGFRESAIMAFGIFSTMTVLVIEHANIDIVIFAFVVAAGYLASHGARARWAAYLLAILAASFKFYPVVLLILAMREKPRRFVAVGAVAVALLAFYFLAYRSDFFAAWNAMPPRMTSHELSGFGAINLPRGLTDILAPAVASNSALAWMAPILPWLLLGLLTAGSVAWAVAGTRVAANRARLAALPMPHAFLLIAGAVLIVTCFFAGQSNEHRGIFFLPVLVGLGVLARGEGGQRYRLLAFAIVVLMWRYFLTHCAFWLLHASWMPGGLTYGAFGALWLWFELMWWSVVSMLLGLLLAFAVDSPVGRAARSAFRPQPVVG